jgi:hypothetical protein
MTAATAAPPLDKPKAYRAILVGGLAAGVLDISYAFVASGLRGHGPVTVLQSVASGLLGRAAFEGGLATAALGTALHFFIATTAAAVYYAASRQLDLLVRYAVVLGMLYGIAVYLFMNFVVLPLSAVPFTGPRAIGPFVAGLVGHMLLVGLPIALAVRWGSR